MEKFKSRKFWMAVISALVVIANEGLGIGIPEDVIIPFASLIIAYIFGEAAVDIARAKKE